MNANFGILPSLEEQIKDKQKRYEALKAKVKCRADEFNDLMEFLETKTAWLTAPASTRHIR